LYGVDADSLSKAAITALECSLFSAAAAREAAVPSYETFRLPASILGRERVDPQTGQRFTEFYGRQSCIATWPTTNPTATRFKRPVRRGSRGRASAQARCRRRT
jgi:hypothetical protein